jgi:hypothetical protein
LESMEGINNIRLFKGWNSHASNARLSYFTNMSYQNRERTALNQNNYL